MMTRFSLFTLVVLTACSSGFLPPTLIVDLADNEWGDYVVLVYDGSGLVSGGRSARQGPAATQGAIAHPERQELEVGWTGGACSHRPTLEVTGSADALGLIVRNPHDPQVLPFLPVSCPAVGVPLNVTLSLTRPVAQDAVTFEVEY